MNIVSSFQDQYYARKYRDKKFCQDSKWEWGLGDDDSLYCRDDAKFSLFAGYWSKVEFIRIQIDLETIHRISQWIKSCHIKGSFNSLKDREAYQSTA